MIKFFAVTLLILTTSSVFGKDVHVKGYTKRNGTYVKPHVRSAPDGDKSNNYGSSNGYQTAPKKRDHDNDGTPNYRDNDDDNDGVKDNQDSNQYGY